MGAAILLPQAPCCLVGQHFTIEVATQDGEKGSTIVATILPGNVAADHSGRWPLRHAGNGGASRSAARARWRRRWERWLMQMVDKSAAIAWKIHMRDLMFLAAVEVVLVVAAVVIVTV